MREFEIEQVSLNVKWIYERIIPSLPTVGTEAFRILCKRLAPLGLSASRIFADAPTNKLSDVLMTIILLEGRFGIKFSVSFFEIIVDELYEDDEQNVVDIANIIFEALKEIDSNIKNGKPNINLRYHLKLNPGENTKILSEHLSLSSKNKSFNPEMAIYKINLEENELLQTARVAIAKSVAYENSVFLDVNLDYFKIENTTDFAVSVQKDVTEIFSVFGLKEQVSDS